MALTLLPRETSMKVGLDRLWIGKVVCDDNYLTGGYSLSGLAPNSKVKALLWCSTDEPTPVSGYTYHFNYDTQKLVVIDLIGGGELANESENLDGVELEICALID